MGRAVIKLSADHRILLQLYEYQRYCDDWEVPVAISQLGLSQTLDMRQAHVSRALKKCKNKKLVYERTVHISGLPRRRKAYFLTPKGERYTRKMREDLKQKTVRIRTAAGTIASSRLGELTSRYHIDSPFADIVERILGKAVVPQRFLCTGTATATVTAVDDGDTTGPQMTADAKMAARAGTDTAAATATDPITDGGSAAGTSTGTDTGTDTGIDTNAAAAAAGHIDRDHETAPSSASSLPKLRYFFGRETEREQTRQWLRSTTHTHILYIGIAGIGKTTLANKIQSEFRREAHVPVLYYQVNEWDTARTILRPLALFFTAHGRTELEQVLSSTEGVEWGPITAAVRTDLDGFRALVILDDCHRYPDPSGSHRLFKSLLGAAQIGPRRLRTTNEHAKATTTAKDDRPTPTDSLGVLPFTKFLILTRTSIPYFDLRDVKLRKRVGVLELEGLDPSSCRALAAKSKVGEQTFAQLYSITGGHPLAFELIGDQPLPTVLGQDFSQFIEDEVYTNLSATEREILGLAVTYRHPVEAAALTASKETQYDDLVALTRRSLLKPTVTGQYRTHDLVIEYLRTRLPPAVQREHHTTAAEYYQSRLTTPGLTAERHREAVGEALYHLVAAGAVTAAIELLQAYGDDLVRSGYPGLAEPLVQLERLEQQQAQQAQSGQPSPRIDRERIDLLALIGDYHARIGDSERAIEYYEQYLDAYLATIGGADSRGASKSRAGAAPDPQRAVRTYNNLATLSAAKQEWDRSLYLYGKSLELATRNDDALAIARAHNNRGIVYRSMNRYDRAAEEYEAALAVLAPVGESRGMAITRVNLGLNAEQAGDGAAATEHFERALALAERDRDWATVMTAAHCLARRSLVNDDPTRAGCYLDRSLAVGQRHHLPTQLAECHTLRGEMFEAEGQPMAALRSYRAALETLDAIAVTGTPDRDTGLGPSPASGRRGVPGVSASATPSVPVGIGAEGVDRVDRVDEVAMGFGTGGTVTPWQQRTVRTNYNLALDRIFELAPAVTDDDDRGDGDDGKRSGSEDSEGEGHGDGGSDTAPMDDPKLGIAQGAQGAHAAPPLTPDQFFALVDRGIARNLAWGDPKRAAQLFMRKGALYLAREDLKHALGSYLDAESQLRRINEPLGIALANQNIGYIFELRREFPRALERYTTAFELYRSVGAKRALKRAARDLGQCLVKAGRPSAAEPYLELGEEGEE